MTELGPVFESLLAILDRLEVPYLVGGSVASGSYGLPRQTNDIDIVADFGTTDLEEFYRLVSKEFYLDRQTATEAIRLRRPFNAIHLKGAFKFDFFPAAAEGFPVGAAAKALYCLGHPRTYGHRIRYFQPGRYDSG